MSNLLLKILCIILILFMSNTACYSAVNIHSGASGIYGGNNIGLTGVPTVRIHTYNGIGTPYSGSISQRVHYQPSYSRVNVQPVYNRTVRYNNGYSSGVNNYYHTGHSPHYIPNYPSPPIHHIHPTQRITPLPRNYTYTTTTTYYPAQTIYIKNGDGSNGTITTQQSYTTTTGTNNLSRFLSW